MIISKKIQSEFREISEFINDVLKKIKPFLDDDELFGVHISLYEALVNAIKHGNKMNPKLNVDIFLKLKDNRLIIKVQDQGSGFDYKKIPDPTEVSNLLKRSGRGIFLIRNFMDRVRFFDRGRGIEMVKFLKGRKDDYKGRKE